MNPKLIIPQRMSDVLTYLAEKPLEWTAFGEVTETRVPGGIEFRLDEIHFPEQTNSKAETDIGKDVLCKLGPVLRKKGVDTAKLKLWIHSHNSMGTGPSGTDVDQMESFDNGSYYLGLIVSSKAKWSSRMALFSPARLDLPLDVEFEFESTPQEVLDAYKTSLEAVELKEKEKVFKHQEEPNRGGTWIPYYVTKELNENPMSEEEIGTFNEYMELGYTREASMRFIVDDRDVIKGNKFNQR